MSFHPLSACHRHPQERGVGVCSACLAQRLVSLAQPRHLPAEDTSLCGESNGSPPGSPSQRSVHLQAIAEEEDSAGGEACRRESSDFAVPMPSCLRNPDDVSAGGSGEDINGRPVLASLSVEADAGCECPNRNDEEAILGGQEALLKCEKGDSFDEREAIVNKDIGEVQFYNAKIFCGSEREASIGKAEEFAEKKANWKRSKSLGALGAASIKQVPRISSSTELADRSAGGRKVSLRSLFELDDAERQEMRSSESALTKDAKKSRNHMHNAEELFKCRARMDEKPNVVETPCHHSHDLLCWSCRALSSSSASIVSSVCSARIKQSVWSSAFLCRKTAHGKASRVHEFRHQNLVEHANAQASIDDRFFRSIYIASESRVSSMRSSGSKIKFHAVRSLMSSSEPTLPTPFRVDLHSELKFNLTARALAIDVPSMFQAGIRQDDSATSNSGELQSSCQLGCNQGPCLPVCDGLSMDRMAMMRPSEMKICIPNCNGEIETDSESSPKMREEELAEDESTLFTTPIAPAGMALDAAVPATSRKMNRIAQANERADDDSTETELIKVCQRVVESHHRRRPVSSMSPRTSNATTIESPFEREIEIPAQWRDLNSGVEEDGPTKKRVAQQEKELVSIEIRNDGEPKKEKERTTGRLCPIRTGDHEEGEGEDPESRKTEQPGEIENGEAGQENRNEEWGREDAEYRKAGQTGEAEHGEAVQAQFDEAGEEEVANCGKTCQRGETAHGEAGRTQPGRTGQLAETEHCGADQAWQGEARDGGSWQRVGMDRGEAGYAKEITQADSGVAASWTAERVQQQQQQQQQQEIWEPYSKSSKVSRSNSRMSSRWQPPYHNVQIVPDHPLLRFYLTPLRSSGRMRSRRLQSPKRPLWPLVFV